MCSVFCEIRNQLYNDAPLFITVYPLSHQLNYAFILHWNWSKRFMNHGQESHARCWKACSHHCACMLPPCCWKTIPYTSKIKHKIKGQKWLCNDPTWLSLPHSLLSLHLSKVPHFCQLSTYPHPHPHPPLSADPNGGDTPHSSAITVPPPPPIQTQCKCKNSEMSLTYDIRITHIVSRFDIKFVVKAHITLGWSHWFNETTLKKVKYH